MPRPRGSQPGNTNALKHGFYSRQFRQVDLEDLDVINATLENEIAAMRVTIRRMLELTEGIPDPIDAIHALALTGNQIAKIAGLLRTQHLLAGGHDESFSAAMSAIAQVLSEFSIEIKRENR